MSKRMRGLDEGDRVKLIIADMEALDARIEGLGDGFAIVGLFREPPVPLAGIGPIEGAVEATSARGITRLVGTLQQHQDHADVAKLTFDQGPEVIQRRQFVRIDTSTEVTVTREDGSTHQMTSINLSGAGLLIGGRVELEMEEKIVMDIQVAQGEPPIHARGRVVRENEEGQKGVRIELIEEGDRERLIHFVFERQRTAPRVRVR